MERPDNALVPEVREVQRLLEAVQARYGFDFRDYALASLKRRVHQTMRQEQLGSIAELQDRIVQDSACMERFLLILSVNTTAMFRDPDFFLALRAKVVPQLRMCPLVRIWQVGCSTGEEVYSLAILLREEGLGARCRIYATDMNEAVVARARAGIIPLSVMQEYTRNHQKAGGTAPFSDYYTARYDHALLDPTLRSSVVFAQHNLVTDGSFQEFHLILCRNVTIYFNQTLQDRVHRLLYSSLGPHCVLGLGSKESIRFTPQERCYEELDSSWKLYRRIH